MVLYAVRHGQTEKNKYGLVQGQTEADLNEVGISEAEKLQSLVSNLNIDVVISSDLLDEPVDFIGECVKVLRLMK